MLRGIAYIIELINFNDQFWCKKLALNNSKIENKSLFIEQFGLEKFY